MERIIMSRGMGKTTRLFEYANDLAIQYPNKIIFFVCSNVNFMQQKFYNKVQKNIIFISMKDFIGTKMPEQEYFAVIDEIDIWLKNKNVCGYTMTIGD